MCSVQYVVCSVQYVVCSVQYAVCTVHCAVCSVQYAVCSVQRNFPPPGCPFPAAITANFHRSQRAAAGARLDLPLWGAGQGLASWHKQKYGVWGLIQNKPAAQAADPSRCNSTNRPNPPLQ